jgi:hypothetical protein
VGSVLMAKTQDRDLSLKLRFRRILFCQGYWSPIEVELSQYESLDGSIKRRSLTDLDVLGVKYDELFTPFRVVGDCKSGRNVSDVNRLFWLKGVSDYFGADQAYFIYPVIKVHTRGIAPKLGLRVLDEEALSVLEKNLDVAAFGLPLADISVHEAIAKLWGINVPKGNKPNDQQLKLKQAYSFLSYSYWYIEQHRNLLNVINHFTEIAPLLDIQNAAHVLLAYTGLERFAHSLLETASFVFAQGGTNVPRDARSYIYGGPLALKERETFFKLLRDLTNSNEQLDPSYLQDVIELLGRMIRNPDGACDILRHISAIYLWCVHLRHSTLLPLNGAKENTAAIVLTRDAALTFARITGISEAIYKETLAL